MLANDTDPENQQLSATVVSGPSNGTLTLRADGSFSYVPRSGFTGKEVFTYQISDGVLSSGVVTVVINVDQQLTPVPSDSSSGSGSSSNSGTTNSGDSTVTDTTPAAVDTTVLAASTQGSEAGGNPQSNADAAVGNAVDAGGTTTVESLLAGAAIVEPTELQKSSGPDIRLENARFRLEVANLENVRFRSEGALGSGLHFSSTHGVGSILWIKRRPIKAGPAT